MSQERQWMMRQIRFATLPFIFLIPLCAAQQSEQSTNAQTTAAPIQSAFHVRYISGTSVYIDGGRDAGLLEGTKLILKQSTSGAMPSDKNRPLEPGIIAKLSVVAVASTSAVCEVTAATREITLDDVISLSDAEVEKLVEKSALGNTRQYPIVISFSEGDPLDEEVRETLPRPPLPEVNQLRGRIGFDISTIREIGQNSATSNTYGMVFRADFTRIFGTHLNLNGYWRGNLRTNSSASQQSIQDLINRTYLMSLSYINPESHWTAGIGRLYLPWASSLETIDGAYVGRQMSPNTVASVFAGSTPDPTAWNYNPQRRIGGALFNFHGGSFEAFRFSSTVGAGVELLKWTVNRPFVFTENDISFKRYFSLYHSMQIDRPSANPSMPAVGTGIGQSLTSLRVQVHPRVSIDVTDTYFRDVPTYDPTLVGTGLLDKYLYQGINGGARIQFPRHITGYFSLGRSSDSNDAKSSLNSLYGATVSQIWKTGIEVDARYSKFDSAFAAGTYRVLTISRDFRDNLRLNLQAGRYDYTSSVAATSNSSFVNLLFDSNLGARLFLQSAFTLQRGGSLNYNQWTTSFGYRFDNRALSRRVEHGNHP
jgi:hypothetical protein